MGVGVHFGSKGMGCSVGFLLEYAESVAHGAPDNRVSSELDCDIPCLGDLPLMMQLEQDEIWGDIQPESLRAFIGMV